MIMWKIIPIISIIAVVSAGCGHKSAGPGAGSFGMAASSSTNVGASARPSDAAGALPKNGDMASAQPKNDPKPEAAPSDTAASAKAGSPAQEAQNTPAPKTPDKDAQNAPVPKMQDNKPVQPATAALPSNDTGTASAPASAPAAEAKTKPSASSNTIDWTQFFDDDKQTAPSRHFWDLSGKTVQIKGFMGEVLSFEKHWFLLIPAPGAECPFDNGDETYWNKIMIVFVPDNVKLRYTSGPLKVTGKLDVGIKLDQSGYKTMFRLYDASFEKIKE